MIFIESRQNGTLRHLARLSREKKYRLATGEMLCEGEKMLGEALSSGTQIKFVLVRGDVGAVSPTLLAQAEALGAQLFCTTEALLQQASDVETPQSVVFSCVPPMFGVDALEKVQRVLVLEGLQDPGNMGTILRTADAFALDAVVLVEGCTDAYAPKVVRATMGAIFRLPVVHLALVEAAQALRQSGMPIYAAALVTGAVPVGTVPLCRSAIIVGSEGHGVSAAAVALADGSVILPMQGRAESLNAGVAASILMWEMTRAEARPPAQ